jgi:hypothetical protein
LRRNFEGKLSVQSRTKSYWRMISEIFEGVARTGYVVTVTSGFIASICALADSTFGMPTSGVWWMICRWRLVSSTLSSSMSPRVPMPAAARYNAAGEPRPPVPTINTLDASSFSCPTAPTLSRMMCRLYRSFCCVLSATAASLENRGIQFCRYFFAVDYKFLCFSSKVFYCLIEIFYNTLNVFQSGRYSDHVDDWAHIQQMLLVEFVENRLSRMDNQRFCIDCLWVTIYYYCLSVELWMVFLLANFLNLEKV